MTPRDLIEYSSITDVWRALGGGLRRYGRGAATRLSELRASGQIVPAGRQPQP